jgi:hypothetical protein
MTDNSAPASSAPPERIIYSEWEINLGKFVALRAVTFLGLLAVLLFLFIKGSDSAELFFHFIIILSWFAGSFIIEAFVVTAGRPLRLRCGLFAMADTYLMLSLFSNAGGSLLPGLSALAGYTLLAAVSCGLFVGFLSASMGIIAFSQGYLANVDVDSQTLVFTAFAVVAALACACLWKCGLIRTAPMHKSDLENIDVPKLLNENKDLRATVAGIQEQLAKITKERDDILMRSEGAPKKEAAENAAPRPEQKTAEENKPQPAAESEQEQKAEPEKPEEQPAQEQKESQPEQAAGQDAAPEPPKESAT